MSLSELMIDIPTQHEQNVFGQFDAYAKKLERTFHVTLVRRESQTGSHPADGAIQTWQHDHRAKCRLCHIPCL